MAETSSSPRNTRVRLSALSTDTFMMSRAHAPHLQPPRRTWSVTPDPTKMKLNGCRQLSQVVYGLSFRVFFYRWSGYRSRLLRCGSASARPSARYNRLFRLAGRDRLHVGRRLNRRVPRISIPRGFPWSFATFCSRLPGFMARFHSLGAFLPGCTTESGTSRSWVARNAIAIPWAAERSL